MTLRYSPHPIDFYGTANQSRILQEDPAAWNLAYLSWDFDSPKVWPDPQFSTHVRRTLQFVVESGKLDLIDEVPASLTVRGFLMRPAPMAVRLLLRMSRVAELPLAKAYGATWIATIQERSHKYREPFDMLLDFPVGARLAQAAEVIRRVK